MFKKSDYKRLINIKISITTQSGLKVQSDFKII